MLEVLVKLELTIFCEMLATYNNICFKQTNTKMKRHYMKMTEGSFFALTVSKNEVISFISNVCVTMSSTVCMCGIMSLISCDWMLEYLSSCTLLWVSWGFEWMSCIICILGLTSFTSWRFEVVHYDRCIKNFQKFI